MELNDRRECVQELPNINREQIGYLGICGQKHPLFIGHNKIGRDPQTCHIVLKSHWIAKQHALINIINKKELMVMDLDSIGRTKLFGRDLSPYIPYRINNGDVVEFGNLFGVVTLLEDDKVEPTVSGISVASKDVSNLNEAPTASVHDLHSKPSDVSNMDDFSVTPQAKHRKTPAKRRKTLPIAGRRNTSTTSFSAADTPSTSAYESSVPSKIGNGNNVNCEDDVLRRILEHLPQVRKIDEQHEMEINIYAANKENNKDMFNAESQPFGILNDPIENENKNKNNATNTGCSADEDNKQKLDTPGEEVLIDDIDGECKKQGDIPLLVQAINLTKPKEKRQLNMKMKRMQTKPVPVEPKTLITPEKASSFSIHLCKDQCSHCKARFHIFDKPRHIAQIKKLETQKKVLDNEKTLTIDSCLCDACYRCVMQRNNRLSRRKRVVSKHPNILTRKFPKKYNIKVRRQLNNDTKQIENDNFKKKDEQKCTAPDEIDDESSVKPNENTLEEIIVIESSDDEKQPQLNQNETLVNNALSSDPNHQTNSCETDIQVEPQNELKQQNGHIQFPPDLSVKKILKEVGKVKRSIQDPDKTLEECTKKVDSEPNFSQIDSLNKDSEEDIAKINIPKKIPLNEECTIESTSNKKLADIILLKSMLSVKNDEKEENNENIAKERITILKNISLNKECTIEIIPKKKLPDMDISKTKNEISENTTQVSSENIGNAKESNPVQSDNQESSNRVKEDVPVVDNVSREESSIDTTPRMKPADIILSKGKWLIKKDLNEMLKKKKRSKVRLYRGIRSVIRIGDNNEGTEKEWTPMTPNVIFQCNIPQNDGSVVEAIPEKTPSNINLSENMVQVDKNEAETSNNENKLNSEDSLKTLEMNPSITVRQIIPGESEMNLQCNIEFDNVKEVTSQGWEKCDSTIQFDEETKKAWCELQRPYGNLSSFLRHLVRLEKYFRQGDLIISPRNAPNGPIQ
ncbi:hypothetical protein SFRURICE_003558 [Spodoptera frugiperda]|nr:hypothetical protein SFRURICE_003558 [Spodoptera frugiperda]